LRTPQWFDQARREIEFDLAEALARMQVQSSEDLEVLVYDLTAQHDLLVWRMHDYAFVSWSAPFVSGPAHLISYQGVSDEQSALAYVEKVRGLAEFIEAEVDHFERQAAVGVVPPAFNFPLMAEGAAAFISETSSLSAARESALSKDFASKLASAGIPNAASMREALAVCLHEEIRPAVASAAARVADIGSLATADRGVWALPDGHEFYDAKVKHHTTLEIDPAELHERGRAAVRRLQAELRAIIEEVGFSGGVRDFLAHLRTDASFFLPNTEEGRARYVGTARAYVDSIMSDWAAITTLASPQRLEIRTPDETSARVGGRASYSDPSADGMRPGFILLNTSDMSANPLFQLEALIYHEGVPGHHIQACIALAGQRAPRFRRHLYITGAVEGWALYAERFAQELGRYTDVWSRAGRVTLELFRAVRIVVDTGIHHRRWSFSRALKYMNDNTANAPPDNLAETRRYFNWPGQALGYMVGMDFILDLRERCRDRLGPRFDARDFHDAFLGGGAMPLALHERRVWRELGESI
jgi:uncharacterized protein (DUF885 family)